MKNSEIFNLDNSIAIDLIKEYEYPHEVLPNIKDYIIDMGNKLDNHYQKLGDNIWISNTANVSSSALILGPCIIDDYATIGPNAYIRESVIVGKKSIVGNSCEIKNTILFDEVVVPHFNYVGDSILGYKSHLGAGAILSNVKSDKSYITINDFNTNLLKVGSFLADNVEVGCNSVLNPGTIVMANTTIYPLVSLRGIIPHNSIVKDKDNIIKKIS